MAEIKDVVAYFCKKYPHPQELSKARLTKMVYLADWEASITSYKQMTPINWVFHHFGPYVDDVEMLVRSDRDFSMTDTHNMLGNSKSVISLANNYESNLTQEEKNILDKVITETKDKYWNSFINLVYSTYPITSSERYSNLNLVDKASEYKELNELLS